MEIEGQTIGPARDAVQCSMSVSDSAPFLAPITLLQTAKLVFGCGCLDGCAADLRLEGLKRSLILTPPIAGLANPLLDALRSGGSAALVIDSLAGEPTIESFEEILEQARGFQPDCVIGLGGGSALDVAKLVAALWNGDQGVREVFGIGLLKGRRTRLVCLPTTSGTGSEVSPNAILLDTAENLKKGVVSPHLVPDAAYIDPLLTVSMPPAVTAATGLDALTHCIEAYTNRFAHPVVDLYAIEGIRLAGAWLARAVRNGSDILARERMALASLFGGLCLGPVNTAAVHALAYPLGGEFHVAHGVSNAVLLPHVMEYSLPGAEERYAAVAEALGIACRADTATTARLGVKRVRQLCAECGIPMGLKRHGIREDAIPRLADAAMKVTRLLKNNPRAVTREAAEAIYRAAYD